MITTYNIMYGTLGAGIASKVGAAAQKISPACVLYKKLVSAHLARKKSPGYADRPAEWKAQWQRQINAAAKKCNPPRKPQKGDWTTTPDPGAVDEMVTEPNAAGIQVVPDTDALLETAAAPAGAGLGDWLAANKSLVIGAAAVAVVAFIILR